MAFSIPNASDAAFADQAEPDKVDLDILSAGHDRTGVISGCAVTAQAIPDLTVAVAAGVVAVAGTRATVSAGNVTVIAADLTNPRFDLIAVDNAGTKSRVGGTAAANPVFPAIPANSVILAAVYVPALDVTIGANQITDKRVMLRDTHLLASGTALGPDHTISGANAGEVLRALSATTAAFDAIADADLPSTITRDTEALLQALADAKGDLAVASAADTWARLAVGADRKVLRALASESTGLVWDGSHYCSVYRGTTQTGIVTATFTPINFTSEDSDVLGMHDNSTNPSRITIPTGYGGSWLVNAQIRWETGTYFKQLVFFINGAEQGERDGSSENIDKVVNWAFVISLSAGDYIEAVGYQTSGTNKSILAFFNNFRAIYLGPA